MSLASRKGPAVPIGSVSCEQQIQHYIGLTQQPESSSSDQTSCTVKYEESADKHNSDTGFGAACLRACDFDLQLLLPLLQEIHHYLPQ